jgi:hypothetical protein
MGVTLRENAHYGTATPQAPLNVFVSSRKQTSNQLISQSNELTNIVAMSLFSE